MKKGIFILCLAVIIAGGSYVYHRLYNQQSEIVNGGVVPCTIVFKTTKKYDGLFSGRLFPDSNVISSYPEFVFNPLDHGYYQSTSLCGSRDSVSPLAIQNNLAGYAVILNIPISQYTKTPTMTITNKDILDPHPIFIEFYECFNDIKMSSELQNCKKLAVKQK